MDGGAWWATVHGVAKSGTRLSDFTFTFHFHALEKEIRIRLTDSQSGTQTIVELKSSQIEEREKLNNI